MNLNLPKIMKEDAHQEMSPAPPSPSLILILILLIQIFL